MDKLIEIQNIKILENLNRPINSKEIESVIKNLLTKKSLDWMTSLVNKFKWHGEEWDMTESDTLSL